MSTRLQAVIFDLDDTLLDWSGFTSDWATLERRHIQGVIEYLHERGHDLDPERFGQEFQQRTMDAWRSARTSLKAPNVGAVLLETAVGLGVDQRDIDLRAILEAYRWGAVDGTTPFPEVREVMKLLHDHGIRVGIVTNAFQPMWMRDRELEMHDLLDLFPDCRISAADFGMLKPHPEIFQAALDCLGAAPQTAVFVGDDLDADIVGAQSLGIKAVLRRINRRGFGTFNSGAIPDGVIDTLRDLPPLLDDWFPGWRNRSSE